MSVCDFCGYQTDDENHLYAHYRSCHSCCLTCRFVFLNDDARRRHYLKSYVHNYCEICDRHFQSPRALKGHMETHEKRTVRCPRCNRGFPSKSAMTKHVELGKCYGPLSHPDYVKHVRDWEAETGNPNLFTVPRLGNGDINESYGGTGGTWNGRAYECDFCVREFISLASLNQHLNSGVHFTRKEFRCQKCGFAATCKF